MQRRNPHLQQHQATSVGTTGGSSSSLLPKQPLLHSQPRSTTLLSSATSSSKSHSGIQNGIIIRNSSRTGISIWVLVLIIIILAIAISIFPEQRQMMYNTEQRIEHAIYETEQQIEHDVLEWLSSKQQQYGDEYKPSDADIRMQQQSSNWVDGEKKLKIALKVLVDRQEKGIDLGVPVLTRWLGDDIPVFYSKDDASLNMGLTLEEWNQQIENRYEQMRKDEDHWRQMVIRTLDKQRG
jgi:hypothetical protein